MSNMESYLASTSTTAKSTSPENDQDHKHLIIDERGEKWLISLPGRLLAIYSCCGNIFSLVNLKVTYIPVNNLPTHGIVLSIFRVLSNKLTLIPHSKV